MRTDRFGLVSKLFIFIFSHKKSEVTIMVHVVKSADSDAGGLFIAAVDRVCISEDAEPERVALDCVGFVFPKMPSLNVLRLIVRV